MTPAWAQRQEELLRDCIGLVGLDHRVGHLASMTAADNPWLDIVQGCHTRAAAPSYAMELPHDRGVRRRREPWGPSSKISHVSMRIALNAGSAAHVRSGGRRRALGTRTAHPNVKRPRGLRCPAARGTPGRRTRTASTRVRLAWRFFTAFPASPASIAWASRGLWRVSRWGRAGCAWGASGGT